MGYYTYYHLIIENEKEVTKERILEAEEMLAQIMGEDPVIHHSEYFLPFDWLLEESMKWYEWEEDMAKVAEAFPEIKFCLYGEGEEGEHWRCFFKGDKIAFQDGFISYGPAPNWD